MDAASSFADVSKGTQKKTHEIIVVRSLWDLNPWISLYMLLTTWVGLSIWEWRCKTWAIMTKWVCLWVWKCVGLMLLVETSVVRVYPWVKGILIIFLVSMGLLHPLSKGILSLNFFHQDRIHGNDEIMFFHRWARSK